MPNIKQNFFYYLAIMLMVTTFLPLVNNLPPFLRSHHLWTTLWVLSLLLFYPMVLFNKTMLYILFYGCVFLIATQTIWRNMDEINYNFLIQEFYNISIGASVFIYFTQNNQYHDFAKLTKWSIIFLIITAIMTIVSSAIDPFYARNSYGSGLQSDSEIAAAIAFRKYGGGNYSTAAVFMCLFPLLLYYYRNIDKSIFSKKWIFFICVLFIVALIGMQIFANILFAFLSIILTLLGLKNLKKSILIVGLILSIMIILPKEFYVSSLLSLSEFFKDDSDIKYKLQDLALFMVVSDEVESNETAAGSRADRFPKLWKAFEESPLLGCYFLSKKNENGYPEGGYHLHWINKLAVTGIIGLSLFFIIPYSFIKKRIKTFDSEYKVNYLIAVVSLLGYGIIKTFTGREAWYAFFILLPGLYYLPMLKKMKNKIS